ncbi:MAG: hypothetical protein ACE5HO_12560 [bacterium]
MQQIQFRQSHQSHYLFSDHYLNDTLPKQDVWKGAGESEEVLKKIRNLYLKVRDGIEETNEAQLEKDFVQPILKILGHAFEVQAAFHGSGELIRPDYTFFKSDEERRNHRKLQGKKEYFEQALAVGDAKSWVADKL